MTSGGDGQALAIARRNLSHTVICAPFVGIVCDGKIGATSHHV